ncbi:MAG: TonB-dependent receptor, partial [Acidobacteria bacterium]|nr:TonB-dependent receptor [Acidobacteriota bacterium]
SAAPVLQTENARIGSLMATRNIEDTPIIGRSGHFQFVALMPGGGFTSQARYTINGSRGWANGYFVDGVNSTRPQNGDNLSAVMADRDAMQEVHYDSVNNSAEFQQAATISTTTKAGTNEFHGSFEFTRQNGAWAARNFFAVSRPQLGVQNLSGTIGGPVLLPRIYNGQNRTFFFFSMLYNKSPTSVTSRVNVPTELMRTGDFSQLSGVVRDPLTGTPFAGNRIPAARIPAAATRYQDRFFGPMRPNVGAASSVSGNYGFDWYRNTIWKGYTGRLDHKLTEKNNIYGTATVGNFVFVQPSSALPLAVIGPLYRLRDSATVSLADTHIFSPTIINEFRAGLMRTNWPLRGPLSGRSVVDQLGLTGYPGGLPDEFGIPAVSVTGFQAIAQDNTSRDIITAMDMHDHVSWRQGRHAAKFGVRFQNNAGSGYASSPSLTYGTFAFDGTYSGQPYADFLLGLPRTASRAGLVAPRYDLNRNISFFAQDDWNISSKLTVNIGLRYDLFLPYTDKYDRLANFDISRGRMVVTNARGKSQINALFPSTIPLALAAEAGYPERTLLNPQKANFAPRIGLAYRIGSMTVVRAGYGLFYNNEGNKVYTSFTSGPFAATETFDNAITNGAALFTWPQAYPASAGPRPLGIQDVNGANVNLKNSYSQQWNLSVEHEIFATAIRASYIGMGSRQLPYRRNANQPVANALGFNQNNRPFPFVRNITYVDSGGNQSYQAAQVEANRRLRKGLALNAHWTWSSNLTDTPDDNQSGALIENSYDRRREYGRESYGPQHRFVGNMVLEIPFGKGRAWGASWNRPLQFGLGGWSLSAIGQLQTGLFFTPSFSGSDPSGTNSTGGRPDRIGNGNLPQGQRTLEKWFDASAFTTPPKGRFGNSGRGTLVGPGVQQTSLALFKSFQAVARVAIRFQIRATNALNTANFAAPASNISTPGSVARITGTSGTSEILPGARYVEMGLRLMF